MINTPSKLFESDSYSEVSDKESLLIKRKKLFDETEE